VQVREPGDERGAVVLLELVELRGVDQACDQLSHVVGLACVGRDHAVELFRRVGRLARLAHIQRDVFPVVQTGDDPAHQG
jgi:hypothetical protein